MIMELLKDRLKSIKDLEEFLENSHQALDNVYQKLNWKEREFQISNNVVSKGNKNEFSEELLLPDPLPQSLVNSKTRIIIDHEQQEKILQSLGNENSTGVRKPPQASGELIANFSKEERLAISNHVLATTTGVDPPPEIIIPDEIESSKNQSTSGLSHIELMKLERDMKRRRQAYRTKVSTKNKTQTEVTREIIGNMMEFLEPKKEEKHLSHKNDRNEIDSNDNRKYINGTSRCDDTKNHKLVKNQEKYESSNHMYRKSNFRRSRSRDRETSRDRRYKRERRSHSRDRKQYEQSSSNENYRKKISSMKKDKSKNTTNSENISRYNSDENEEIIQRELKKNNVIDSYVKKEKHPEQSTKERLSTDSENEKERKVGLSKSSESQNEKVQNDSLNHASRNTERYLSEGEIISSDYDNEPDNRMHSKKKKKKKKKHKEHKHRHKKNDD